MFAIICRRRLPRLLANVNISLSPQILAAQNAVFMRKFSSKQSSSGVNGDDSKQSFTISYLINSCGFSSKDALFVSKKVTIKWSEKPDSVLELLRKYGFTNANIQKLIARYPKVLFSCPKQTLLPKLEFFRSIGVPLDELAKKLSTYPLILRRSLKNYLIPSYDFLKTLVKSDERVVNVFMRAARAVPHGLEKKYSSIISILRERGIPESSIASMIAYKTWFLVNGTGKLASCIDRAAEMGFDRSRAVFMQAVQVFVEMSESTLKQKMEVYRRFGWSESDVSLAFSKYPFCMKLSEKKIMDNMDFLVNDLGLKPDAIARRPLLIGLNLEKRMKPRFSVARVLKERGLLKKRIRAETILELSEEKFLKRYIVNYQEDVPELLDIYRGKLSVSEMGFSQQVISK